MIGMMGNFYIWDRSLGYNRVRKLPKPHNLREMPLNNIIDFVEIMNGHQLHLEGDAIDELPRFWKDLAIELVRRLDKN